MDQQKSVSLLAQERRLLAPQDDAGAPQVRPQCIEGAFDLQALVIERGQFGGQSRLEFCQRGERLYDGYPSGTPEKAYEITRSEISVRFLERECVLQRSVIW